MEDDFTFSQIPGSRAAVEKVKEREQGDAAFLSVLDLEYSRDHARKKKKGGSKGVPGSESRTGGRLVSLAGGREKKKLNIR